MKNPNDNNSGGDRGPKRVVKSRLVRRDQQDRSFDLEFWQNRIETEYEDQTVFLLSREDLIRAKKAAGRPQDLLDAAALESSHKKKL